MQDTLSGLGNIRKRSDATTPTSNGNNCANSSSINIKSFGQRSTCICCQSLSSRIQFLADLNDIRSLGAHHHQSQDAAPASLITLCNSATACRIRAVAVQPVEGWSMQVNPLPTTAELLQSGAYAAYVITCMSPAYAGCTEGNSKARLQRHCC